MVVKKQRIPRALREQVWLNTMGEIYEHKCPITWCKNMITVFNFHVGHNIPESKGGKTEISNLTAICARCNYSMSNNYTITEWSNFGKVFSQKENPSCVSDTVSPVIETNKVVTHIKKPWWKRLRCF